MRENANCSRQMSLPASNLRKHILRRWRTDRLPRLHGPTNVEDGMDIPFENTRELMILLKRQLCEFTVFLRTQCDSATDHFMSFAKRHAVIYKIIREIRC